MLRYRNGQKVKKQESFKLLHAITSMLFHRRVLEYTPMQVPAAIKSVCVSEGGGVSNFYSWVQ